MTRTDRRIATRRRVAALGTLSAAGLALAGSEAEAGIIHPGIPGAPVKLGFAAGDQASLVLPFASASASLSLKRFSVGGPVPLRSVYAILKKGTFSFAVAHSKGSAYSLQALKKGATWNKAVHHTSFSALGPANLKTSQTNPTHDRFSNQYYLFSFLNGTTTDYGWLQVSLTDNSFNNLTLVVTDYAWDNTGAKIPAGFTGAAPTPEPASVVTMLAGAALVAGAAGVRRWKAARAAK
jgi:hypothetical protein